MQPYSNPHVPPPIDAELWSRPCKRCKHRIDKCTCKEGPTGYGKAASRPNPLANDGGGYTPEQLKKMLNLREVDLP